LYTKIFGGKLSKEGRKQTHAHKSAKWSEVLKKEAGGKNTLIQKGEKSLQDSDPKDFEHAEEAKKGKGQKLRNFREREVQTINVFRQKKQGKVHHFSKTGGERRTGKKRTGKNSQLCWGPLGENPNIFQKAIGKKATERRVSGRKNSKKKTPSIEEADRGKRNAGRAFSVLGVGGKEGMKGDNPRGRRNKKYQTKRRAEVGGEKKGAGFCRPTARKKKEGEEANGTRVGGTG